MNLLAAGVLIVLVACSAAAEAQTIPPRWVIGATAGAGQTWDDEGSIGSGWLVGAFVQRPLSRWVDVELAADILRHERSSAEGSSFRASGHTAFISAGVVARFGPRRANAFVTASGTIGVHRGTTGFGDGPNRATNDAHPGVMFGGGLSFAARRVEVAPILRLTLMRVDDDSDPFSTVMGGIRIGLVR